MRDCAVSSRATARAPTTSQSSSAQRLDATLRRGVARSRASGALQRTARARVVKHAGDGEEEDAGDGRAAPSSVAGSPRSARRPRALLAARARAAHLRRAKNARPLRHSSSPPARHRRRKKGRASTPTPRPRSRCRRRTASSPRGSRRRRINSMQPTTVRRAPQRPPRFACPGVPRRPRGRVCVPRRPARPVPMLTSLASGRGRPAV